VVDVIEHGRLPDGTSYLVMELLRGESLQARLERVGRLEPRDVLPIGRQVCEALVAVHAAGVVHRDLKPSNIFLMEPGPPTLGGGSGGTQSEPRVKVIDFGIARVEWEETRITNMGAPIGTPGYMSPEQESGADIDARTDIFSFGAVMYECLVGEPPPPRKPSYWPPPGHGDSDPPPGPGSGVQSATRAPSPAWQAFIARAMAPDPSDRFPDARTMGQALRELEVPSTEPLPAATPR
jgi:serine/threonine-protein kinase